MRLEAIEATRFFSFMASFGIRFLYDLYTVLGIINYVYLVWDAHSMTEQLV